MDRELAATLARGTHERDGTAKYLQLRNAIANAITAGAWKAGDRLPTEDELVAATGVSLGTVQRAMRMLVDDRLVVRRQGAGSFVAAAEAPMDAPLIHCRFLDEETGRTLPIFSHVVRRRQVRARGWWSAHLTRTKIACVERLFSISNEFVVYTHLYFEHDRFPALAARFTNDASTALNVKDVIARDFHLTLRRYSEKLSVRAFPDYVCRALDVAADTSGAVLDIVAFDQAGAAVYVQDLFVPPNNRRLVITPE